MNLPEKAKSFPRKPGVYLFRGAKDEVLYVGKAKSLRDRVRSYFLSGRDDRPQVAFLLKRTRDIEFIVTDSEKEALLLENTLIKRHRPRYNLQLRDDKSYVSIRIGAEHPFPGISLTRRAKKDGAIYFGPYDSSTAAREAVEQIVKFFRVRTCRDREFANRIRPCLKFDIGRCTAPCVKNVSIKDYERQVEEARMFLSGRSAELIKRLKEKMKRASEDMRYEDASRFRDAISMLKDVRERQKVVIHAGGDHDAIGLARKGDDVSICALRVRGGLLLERRVFHSAHSPSDDSKLLEEFLMQRYREGTDIPPRILLFSKPEGKKPIAEILSERRAKAVTVSVPSRGPMRRLVELACTNASEALAQTNLIKNEEDALRRLAGKIGLREQIENIECVDISNLSGREAVGSVVSFVHGVPDKANYRTYNIRTVDEPDDYGMMREVLSRRFIDRIDRRLPDLLLVDGGKGHLAVAIGVMKELSLSVPLVAIAKAKGKDDTDRVFLPGRKNPLKLKKGSKELLLLMRIRDEAHRFAIKAHRRRHSKKTISESPNRVP